MGKKGGAEMGARDKPSYWAVLPATVRYDEALSPNAKLLYAEISALTNSTGYCWASNERLASLFGLGERTVSRLITQLEERGYIRCEMAAIETGSERRIYAGIFSVRVQTGGVAKNGDTPQGGGVAKNGEGGIVKIGERGVAKNGYQNNKSINNIPPISPTGGKRVRRQSAPRKAPDWKPERFAGFWDYYPKQARQNKQEAMNAWDELRPDDALIATIGKALKKLKATELWRRGVGIPYPQKFLRKQLWTNADELDGPEADEPAAPRAVVDRGEVPDW